MFLYGNSRWRVELKWLTGWSNEILRAIRCKEEWRIYRDAGLIEKRVNDRQQFDHEKAAHWMARFEDFKDCY